MINLSAQTFSSSKTPIGTTVATVKLLNQSQVTEPANYTLSKGAAGFFNMSGGGLVTLAVIPPGTYSVRVRAVATTIRWRETAYFPITATA